MDLQGWDEQYRAEPGTLKPTPLLVDAASKLKPGKALDLACGTGRNAIWLAEHGWQVTAVDGSAVAIDLLRKRAPSVDARLADLEQHEYTIEPAAWDLIAVCYYLQRDLFEPVKRGLKPGGVAVVIVHLGGARFGVQPGELAKYFEGWKVTHSFEGKTEHHRPVAEIVAAKTSAT